ncbi:putative RNA-directed DNA polymerase [Tanacetum coccineum]
MLPPALSLRNLSKGTSTVSDYGRQFKGICDKLAAIGQPVDEMDKLHLNYLWRKQKFLQVMESKNVVNHTVRKIFEDNGTLHRLSCPYTPQQNGRAERKHRHLVETGLVILFHAQFCIVLGISF